MKINKIKKLLLVSSIAMASSQVSAVPTARIIGGTQATAGSYPWVVSLKNSDGEHFCGASLIEKQWVMTAAHCVDGETASNISVVVGEFNTVKEDAGEQKRKVSKIIMHSQYGDDNDIALLKLASPVSNATVTQVVPNIMKDIKAGTLLTVMGWGNQSSTGDEFPNRLFQVEVPLVSNQQCATNYEAAGTTITENMVCAGFKQGGKDSCQGDSGGPLLYQLNGTWQQVGIVSFGEGCALPDLPGVYTRVEKYNDWVKQQITATTDSTAVEPETATPVITEPQVPATESSSSELASLNLPEEIELITKENIPEKSIVKMKNTTTKNINIVDISVNQSAFKINQNDCVKVLKAGDSCELSLSYQPQANSNDAEGDLIIDLDNGTNISVALYGSKLNGVDETDSDISNADIEWYLDSDAWVEADNGYNMDGSGLDLNDFATISAEIDGEGAFAFDLYFENDADKNFCSYYVDGKLVRTIRGSKKSTTHHVTQLSKGLHEIMWVYKKKSENSGSLKIKNIKLSKAGATPASAEPATSTPNSLAPTSTTTKSGGGSTEILFLSALFLLLGRRGKWFVKH